MKALALGAARFLTACGCLCIFLLFTNVSRASIVNGDFEASPDFVGWTNGGDGFVLTERPAMPPTRYAHASYDSTQAGQAELTQAFTLPADAWRLELDLLSLVLNCSADCPAYASATMHLPGGSQVNLFSGPSSAQDGSFRRYTHDVTAFAGQPITLTFSVLSNAGNTAVLRVDRIVIDVPEPATGFCVGVWLVALCHRPRQRTTARAE